MKTINKNIGNGFKPFPTNKKGFTLVELIIVITILAILATIAFISFRWYLSDSRDANRLSTLNNIEKWLILYETKTWNYPTPDTPSTISVSWTIISYQWYVWDNVSRVINMNKTPLDPLDNIQYYYATWNGWKWYKLLSYQEWDLSYWNIISQTYAFDYTTRQPKVIWKWPAIITDINNNIILANIDLFLTESWTTYKAMIDDTTSLTWSGKDIWGWLQILATKWWNFSAPTNCPTWFIPVPWNPEFAQPGFCVSKYEMTWNTPWTDPVWTNSWNTYQWTENPTCFTSSTWCSNLDDIKNHKWWITSKPGYPIASITQKAAIDACASIWWHLITNNEWMTIARNIEANPINWSWWIIWTNLYNGISNSHATTPVLWCNWQSNSRWGVSSADTTCTKRINTLSNWETIYDLAWNVWEHVNKANTLDGINYNVWKQKFSNTTWWTITWTPPNDYYAWNPTWWNNTNITTEERNKYWPSSSSYTHTTNWVWNIHGRYINDTSYPNNIFLRGGNAGNGAYSGVFTMYLYRAASHQSYHVGFRCSF